jgi:hypothetical protein
MSESKTIKVAKINEVDILVIENGEKRVAIKPICQALGIDPDSQRKKLTTDPILSSVTVLSTATGSDGKQYEMVTIPLKFVFGWLFRIDSRNVNEAARDSVLKYQLMCYEALYDYFSSYADFVEQKQRAIEQQLDIVEKAKINFKNTRGILEDAEKQLKVLRQFSYSDFNIERRQLKLFPEEEMN